MLVMTNLLFSIGSYIYYNPTNENFDVLAGEETNSQNRQSELQSEETGALQQIRSSTDQNFETSVGNTNNMGWSIARIIVMSFIPWNTELVNSMSSAFIFEKLLAYGIIILRSILTLLTSIEIYMFFKNRKTS